MMDYETDPQLPQREARTWSTRLTGSCLVVLALLLSDSLLSYNHSEMGWDFLNPNGGTAAEEALCINWLGLPGLYLAGLCNWMLGAASLYAMALLCIFSVGLVIRPHRPYYSADGGHVLPGHLCLCHSGAAALVPGQLAACTQPVFRGWPAGLSGYLYPQEYPRILCQTRNFSGYINELRDNFL